MTIPAALLLVPLAPSFQDATRAEARTEDVLHVVAELERLHPDPFFGVPREDFEAAVDALLERVDELSETEFTAELMRLVALLSSRGRDGHTLVWPVRAPALPIQLYSFSDGWFMVGADDAQRDLVGARLIALGGVAVEEACARVAPLLTRDNEWDLRQKLGQALCVPALLQGVGIPATPERVTLRLQLPDAGETEIELVARPAFPREPLLPEIGDLRGRERAFWMKVLEPERALYVQYNEVTARDGEGRTLVDFAAEIVRTFEERELERVIVDVRSNGGGDNSTFPPLIRALQTPSINRRGVLFGLIGRATFSAAGNFVTALDRDTNALLVGEPTGGAPNQYGDARDVDLPHHPELLVRISTRYHAFGGPSDARLTHEPDLPVPLASQDYFKGRDPVLERALQHREPR